MIGKIIDYQAKQLAYNVYSYYKKRKTDKTTLEYKEDINLIDTVAEVTGLSKSTVTRIIREGNAIKAEEGVVHFKQQDKKHIRKKRILVDETTEGIIRRKVIQFYTVKNEVPSIRKLNALLKKDKILKCSDEYLRKLLHKLGFTDAEDDSAGLLRERADIVSQRLTYLEDIKGFRNQRRNIFFLNETKRWVQHDDGNEPINVPKGLPSFVIVSVSGFLDGALLMMKTQTKTESDESFERIETYEWMKDVLLPNIPARSVIVMNIPHYEAPIPTLVDEKPTTASTRGCLETWLNLHKVPFKETAKKSELFQLVKNQEEIIEYSLTRLFIENGHEVLHLPPNHSDLNPAVIVWEELKKKAETSSPEKLISSYSKKKWEEKFKHIIQNEGEYYVHDIKADDADHIKQLKKEKEISEDVQVKSEIEDEHSMDCDF